MRKGVWLNEPIPKGGWMDQPGANAKMVTTLYFAPKGMPGVYQIAIYDNMETAEKDMAEYKSGRKIFTFHNVKDGKQHTTQEVEGYYQVDQDWDEYEK
jgi:hypothetical protein